MNNEQENKLEQRIRFVAKHYEEGRLDTDKAWQQFAAKHQVRHTVSFRRYWMAAASVLLLLIGFGTYYITDRNSPEWVAITTIPGQIKDVYLPDSTLISMAGNSSIRYDAKSYGKERRVVEMKGKAFFKVTRNETRPFSVYTERTEVTVLGTSFQINEQPDGTDVNVMTGKVSFGTTGNETDKVILTAGMSASYSMESKGITFEDIYDLYAVRIIFDPLPGVDEKNMCWDIYSAITDIYRIRPDRIRDWVSRPKANGYQALYLTVMGPDGQWVEIQIRSRRMDDIAEKGFAAHWKYKEHSVEEDTELDKWLQTITEILESPDPNALDFLDTIKLNLFTSEIFVFTPKGDIKTLPQGATALDFAYALHTNIGNKCIGAKVNHRLVPLSHPLASGDQVEILTSRSQEPQAEWLNFVTTAKARSKIDAVLKRARKDAAKLGEEKVIVAFKRSEMEPSTSNLDKLCMYFGFSKREEFYYAVEKGDVALPDNIKKLLKEKTDNVLFKYVKQALGVGSKNNKSKEETAQEEKPKVKYDKSKPYILREEAFERNYVIAECCKPIPGDEALGFINDDGNVVVHKRSCPIAMRLKSSFGERILNTEWSSHKNASFEATLEVKGIDSIGVLNTITKTIADDFSVNIMRLLIEAKDGVFEGKIKMKVHDVEDIQKMCVTLSKIKNIKSVGRVAD